MIVLGRCHGDLKPGNILLGEHDNVILGDFGNSKRIDEANTKGTTIGKTKHTHGTPLYGAPEILQDPYSEEDGVAKASRKVDMYAFAMVCYEVCSTFDIGVIYLVFEYAILLFFI